MSKDTDILIVKENAAEAEYLKHILEQHEYRVSIEHDVKNALASIRQNKPQIVISAVLFAGTDGYALCREIKSDDEMKNVAVILLTSLSDATDIIRGMECGADNFITKPYDEVLLISRIKFILLNRELRGGADTQVGVEFLFHNEKYSITPERRQIVDLLLSTYETAVQKNLELMRVQTELNRLNDCLEEKVAERTAQLTEEIIERRTAETSLTKEAAFVELLQIAAVAANEADTIEDAVQICLDRVCKLTKWQLGHLSLLVKDSSDELVPTTLWCVSDPKRFEKFIRATERLRWSEGVGLPGRVLETGKAVWIENVYVEKYFIRTEAAEKAGIKSAFAFPILVNGKVIGVLEFFSIAAEEPNEKLLEVMTSIGIQLGQVIERKRAEMRLQTSEDRYRDLVENSRDLICTHDLEGNILSVNQTAVKALGYDLEILLNQNIQSVLAPEFQNGFDKYIAKLKKEGVAGGLMTVRSASGEKRVWKYNNTLRTEGVDVPIVRGMAMDVTERRQTESKLRASEEWLRAILDGSRDGIVIEDDGKLIYVNQAYAKSLQYEKPEELIGKDVSFVLPPDEAERMTEYGRRRLRGEQVPTIYEFKGKRKDGNLIEVEGAVSTSHIGGKKYIMTAIRDITERKRAEDSLRASERRFRELVDILPIAVYECDLSGLIESYNQRAVELWGRKPKYKDVADSFCGSYKIYSIDGVYLPHAECPMAKVLRTGIRISNEEIIIERLDGSRRTAIVNVLPRRDEQGFLTGAINCLVDITERKQAEENLRLSEERLRQAQKMEAIGTLTGGVAHDFNNLLTAILGNTQLAQRKLAPDNPIQNRLTEVTDAGLRAAELTRKLLAFSRRQHLEKSTIDLNDTIAEIVKLLERIIGEDVEVSVKYADDLQAIFADPGQIEQVVMNLAVNARDAMPEGGKVTIETSNVELDESYCRQYPYVVPGNYVQIRVSDTGSGIDEETQARIFEPFFTTKEVGKGTGLGLSMAYGIVKQHDGHINLYSELGTGTTFKVYLPTDEKTVEEKAPAIPISFLGGNETILVAEDEELLRNLAKDTLEELGYTILLAKDGAEAVEIFNANRGRINLFLTDVVMPRMGGSEAYERIREAGENVPLIFMTGYSAETVQSRFVKSNTTAEELGAAVIQKPYTLEELGRIVREVLDKN